MGTAPLGFIDPAGITNDTNESRFNAYRRAESMHGRVCMHASLGIIVSEKFHPIFDALGDGPFVSAMANHLTEMAAKNFWSALSVNAMQNTLRHGVPFDPMEKFALTSFAAHRDPTMRAQAREEFTQLDHVTLTNLTKLSNVEDHPFITAPLGFFDPAGFTNDITESGFNAYRRAEIKHGRVCMQVSLDMIISEKFHSIFGAWGDGLFVSAMASHFTETAAKNFWPAFWIMTAGHELATSFVDYEGKEVFDYGFDPLNLRPRDDPEKFLEYTNQELNHGRWAMICAAGIIAQELVTGQPVIS